MILGGDRARWGVPSPPIWHRACGCSWGARETYTPTGRYVYHSIAKVQAAIYNYHTQTLRQNTETQGCHARKGKISSVGLYTQSCDSRVKSKISSLLSKAGGGGGDIRVEILSRLR